jgi:hypothetical protein
VIAITAAALTNKCRIAMLLLRLQLGVILGGTTPAPAIRSARLGSSGRHKATRGDRCGTDQKFAAICFRSSSMP